VRLSIDIPLEVRERFRQAAPFRGFWKYALGVYIARLDAELQRLNLHDLGYHERQAITFEVVRQFCHNTSIEPDISEFVESVLSSHKPILPPTTDNEVRHTYE